MKFLICTATLFLCGSVIASPSFEEVRSRYKISEGTVLDRNGEVIHEFRIDAQGRRLEWTRLKDIPPPFLKILVSVEDHRFYNHHGIDWRGFFSATLRNLFSKNSRGASTLTMQLVGKLNPSLSPNRTRRSVSKKINQIRSALKLEKTWTKSQILESYINLVHFRGELQGIGAASRGLFGKDPHGLSQAESLVLVVLLKSPNAGVNQVAKRACQLSQVPRLKLKIPCDSLRELSKDHLTSSYFVRPRNTLAPHATYKLLQEDHSSIVHSTLDRGIQQMAIDVLRHNILSLRKKNVHDSAAIVIENSTGHVLAYIGSMSDLSSAKYVDGVQAKRQAGSALKPFLYARAFDQRLITPSTRIEDSPLDIPVFSGVYRP
ncbi:MAG TPA: transglycosylase domain-containing protein, partial [Bdellovibrionota bacterium]|nr:transglycosylase domain-containing protein [Bdellovibrionota bacterium]